MTATETAFWAWLNRKEYILDEACGRGIERGLRGLTASELAGANESIMGTYATPDPAGFYCAGGDCNYALKGVGAWYTGHYHGKRVHDALAVLMPRLPYLSARPLNMIDVGAGTGAVLWAWALIASFSAESGNALPIHTWSSIEISTEMSAQGTLLWNQLCQALPGVSRLVNRTQPFNSDWRTPPVLPRDGFVIGSYLFSREDLTHAKRTANEFLVFLNRVRARGAILWTKQNKAGVFQELLPQLTGWTELQADGDFQSPLCHRMKACVKVCQDAFSKVGLVFEEKWVEKLNWGGRPCDAAVLSMIR